MLKEYCLLGKFHFFKNYVHKDINLHKKSAVYSKLLDDTKFTTTGKVFVFKAQVPFIVLHL